MLDRHDLTDAEWARLEPLLPDRTPRRGGWWNDHRQVINGLLWRTRTGAPWRDLPMGFGNWNSVFKRVRRWTLAGVFDRIFAVLRGDPDFEYVIADGTIVRVHQKGTGARGGLKIRRSDARAEG